VSPRRPRRPPPRSTWATVRTRRWALPGPLALALILVTAIALHFEALRAPFFADDFLFLDQARFRSLPQTLLSPDPIGNFFRPVSRQLWFWCWAGATGESPVAFHAANLALFLALLLLLHGLIRRALGAWPALVGTAFLALHHAADVPVLWASGSQDLLAVVGSLAAIRWLAEGRPLPAALALAAALLSKEIVVLAPFAAVLVARRESESWWASVRRGTPLFAVLAGWVAAWGMAAGRRPAIGLEVRLGLEGIPAALAHLVQVATGLEWPRELLPAAGFVAPPLVLVAVALAILGGPGAFPAGPRTVGAAEPRAVTPAARHHSIRTGLAWALLGAAPVVAVATIWSAYYYLFALCGVALALAGFVAARPAWVGLLVVLGVGWASHHTRQLSEFATDHGPWTTQSHVNRHYLARGMGTARLLLGQLRAERPTLPPRSTLFFAGLPAQVAFQSADGPLLRWAYRDSSLRSYFLGRFRLSHARRGPVFFFQVRNDVLSEITGRDSLERIATGLFLSEDLKAARDALTLASEVAPAQLNLRYRTAWIHGALGDTAAMHAALVASRLPLSRGPAPERARALEQIAVGDTFTARALAMESVLRHPLDPAAHGLLADLYLVREDLFESGALEAFATRVLAPDDPMAWRRWGMVQFVRTRHLKSRAALERYLALGGDSARADLQVQQTLRELARRLPGGELAQRELHKVVPDPH